MRYLRGLFAQFKAYHENDYPLVQYTGVVGIVAFPLFYLLRYAKPDTQYNDLWLRAAAAVVCLGLAVKTYWPEKARPYFMAYAYAALLFCLPFYFVFTSLVNGGGVVSVANTLMGIFFLILLSDWRNTVVMLTVGAGAASLLYWAVVPDAAMPVDYIGRIPTVILVIIGGSVFKFAEKQAETAKLRRTYTALAGSIAHEVRNPLSQVRLALDSIERALPAPTTTAGVEQVPAVRVDELYRHLSAGQVAVERGLQVVSLTLGEVRASALDPSGFHFVQAASTTRRAVEEFGYETPAQRERVLLRVNDDFTFKGDETVYLFILFNLIRNAIYYFDVYPHAVLSITVDAQRVTVTDTGPGMTEQVLGNLFEAFATSGKIGGTGLGLSYCRRAMRAFGGDIACRSELGKFTEFTLDFPAVAQQALDDDLAQQLKEAVGALTAKHVLVVDDDARLRRSTSEMLAALGCVTAEAADGLQALQMLRGARFDFMVLDLRMPVMDGYATALRLRAGEVPGRAQLPIVALTSEPVHIALPKTRKVGMNAFVSKPTTPLALAAALREAQSAQPRSVGTFEGRSIVLAEDNAYSRAVMRASLERWGLKVSEASDGAAVLHLLAATERGGSPVDLVLMDLNMPGMDGLQATRAIRERGGAWSQLPVVALTGHSEDEMIGNAMEAGITDYLVKPVDDGALRSILLRHLVAPRALDASPAFKPAATPSARPARQQPKDFFSEARILDASRLEQLERVGMLDSLPLYLEQMDLMLGRLATAHDAGDHQAASDALHSLLGASGDAGAVMLHGASRALYPVFAEQRWPEDPQWLAHLRDIAQATEAAMRADYIKNPPD